MANSAFIPTEKIIERLQYENPWWNTRQIPEHFAEMNRRLYFDLFYPSVIEKEIKRAVVLMGPRRVGKTVMMFHTINQLLADGVEAHKIFFAGIDNPIYIHRSLQDVVNLCLEAVKLNSLDGCYVFFDEIQYLKDWERHLKVLVDAYPVSYTHLRAHET